MSPYLQEWRGTVGDVGTDWRAAGLQAPDGWLRQATQPDEVIKQPRPVASVHQPYHLHDVSSGSLGAGSVRSQAKQTATAAGTVASTIATIRIAVQQGLAIRRSSTRPFPEPSAAVGPKSHHCHRAVASMSRPSISGEQGAQTQNSSDCHTHCAPPASASVLQSSTSSPTSTPAAGVLSSDRSIGGGAGAIRSQPKAPAQAAAAAAAAAAEAAAAAAANIESRSATLYRALLQFPQCMPDGWWTLRASRSKEQLLLGNFVNAGRKTLGSVPACNAPAPARACNAHRQEVQVGPQSTVLSVGALQRGTQGGETSVGPRSRSSVGAHTSLAVQSAVLVRESRMDVEARLAQFYRSLQWLPPWVTRVAVVCHSRIISTAKRVPGLRIDFCGVAEHAIRVTSGWDEDEDEDEDQDTINGSRRQISASLAKRSRQTASISGDVSQEDAGDVKAAGVAGRSGGGSSDQVIDLT